jgi:hypothetical protein
MNFRCAPHRTALTSSIVAVALLAGGAGTAVASSEAPTGRADALRHGATMLSLARHHRAPSTVIPAVEPTSVSFVRDAGAQVADDGFSWADGAIGAGVTVALLLSAAGLASSVRRPPTMRAR